MAFVPALRQDAGRVNPNLPWPAWECYRWLCDILYIGSGVFGGILEASIFLPSHENCKFLEDRILIKHTQHQQFCTVVGELQLPKDEAQIFQR